jgi:hypothetical protein
MLINVPAMMEPINNCKIVFITFSVSGFEVERIKGRIKSGPFILMS